YYPKAHILASTTNAKTAPQLCLTKGVDAEVVETFANSDDFYVAAKELAIKTGLAKAGDTIVTVSGALVGTGTNTSSVFVL
ncbi:MAG: pyruvate kinase, partial [Saccharospirillaceae bacterium]|nr:hypothetical protein [Pseudomonadales bacterium]NRB81244.1 pyruvate kinase [Saccharospirillaceae bacterium]